MTTGVGFSIMTKPLMEEPTPGLNGSIAQQVRALALQARGHWFEPSCSHHVTHRLPVPVSAGVERRKPSPPPVVPFKIETRFDFG